MTSKTLSPENIEELSKQPLPTLGLKKYIIDRIAAEYADDHRRFNPNGVLEQSEALRLAIIKKTNPPNVVVTVDTLSLVGEAKEQT